MPSILQRLYKDPIVPMSLGARIGKAHYYPLRSSTHSGLPWDICCWAAGSSKGQCQSSESRKSTDFPLSLQGCMSTNFGFTFFMCSLKFQAFSFLIFSMAFPLVRHILAFYSLTCFARAPFSHFGTTEVMGRSLCSHRWWNCILLNQGRAFVSQETSDEGFFTYTKYCQ